jgi:hypothetical protein
MLKKNKLLNQNLQKLKELYNKKEQSRWTQENSFYQI